jgi:hypothetical protein
MPQQIQREVEQALREELGSWKRRAKDPDERKELAELCKLAHVIMLKATASLGCSWDS